MQGRPKTFTAFRIPAGIALVLGLCLGTPESASAGNWVPTGSLVNAEFVSVGILLHNDKVLVVSGSPLAPDTSELYDPATGTWTTIGPVGPEGRTSFAAVLLRDGRVLLCGGGISTGATFTCRLYDPVANAWSLARRMNVRRSRHTATLLADGRVLVTGGTDGTNQPNPTAETYDPTTDLWTSVPNMATPRSNHTATRLPDGRVMVTGGRTSGGFIARTTEIFDPTIDQWTSAGDLNSVRDQHSATLLPDGTVLAVGGLSSPTATETAEIFDPGPGTWSYTASLPEPRFEHTATLLPSGLVLVAAGRGVSTLPSAHVYDYTTGQWSPAAPAPGSVPDLTDQRYNHSATMLPDGRVLIAGGYDTGPLQTAELYDPDTPNWLAGGTLADSRREHSATLLKDGRVLLIGGWSSDTAEVYDPTTDTSNLTMNTLSTDRWRHTTTLLPDGRVLVAGTVSSIVTQQTAEVYDPATNQWTPTAPMSVGRYWHRAVLLPCGEVLVTGGSTTTGTYHDSAERFNPRTGTWRPTASMTTPRWQPTATLLRDGRVLVTGGYSVARLATAEIYDPVAETWTPTAGTMNQARSGHQALLLPSGLVLISSGLSAATFELFDPVTETFATVSSPTVPHQFRFTLSLLPNGRVLLAGGFSTTTVAEIFDPAANTWTRTVDLNPGREDHTATLLNNGRVLLAGGDNSPYITTALFDVGRGEDTGWRPVLGSVTNPLVEGSALTVSGTLFEGLGEASTGQGSQHSASNYPLVQLHRVDNDAVRWLPVDPMVGWKDTDFRSIPLSGCVPGPTRVTVFTNGIPSVSRIIDVQCPPPTVTEQPVPKDICLGDSVDFTFKITGDCPAYQWRKDAATLAEVAPFTGTRTDTLTITSATLAEAGNYDAVAELSCSPPTVFSAPAALTVSNAPNLSNVAVTLTSPPASVCTTCVGGTITESHLDGGVVTHEWGYRTVSMVGAITWMPGRTGPTYDINGADFPGPGTYYVVARTTPACGLPLVSANEVTVTVTLLLPGDDVAFFTVTSRDSMNVLEWVNSGSHANVRIRYNAGPTCSFPNDPDTSGNLLVDYLGTAGQRERFQHDTPPLTNGWDYCYTIFSDMGGPPYSVGRSNRGRPMNPALGVQWAFSTGVFSLTAPTVGWSSIIATSNDHVVHAMRRGVGAGAGEWPAAWLPISLNGPVQSRSPIVPITVNTSNPVVYLGSQDGSVYVVDADRGGALGGFPRPFATLGGSPGQAAPAGIFTAFGGAYDYLLVGTRDTGADNRFFAFDPDLNPVNPPFNNGGGLNSIGVINGMASVDYLNRRVFFTSHTRGSADTLWCLNLQAGPPATTHRWSRPLGNIDSSPVLMGDRVYVVAPLPTPVLYSIEADMGLAPDRTFPIPDGQAKGFVFPDWRTGDLYFATDNYVWALHDDGASITNKFPLLPPPGGIILGGGVAPTSSVVFVSGSDYLYVGGSDGRLYEIDVSPGPAPIIKSVVLGDGLAAIGSPSLDWQNGLVHVGTEAGVFYAVQVPLP